MNRQDGGLLVRRQRIEWSFARDDISVELYPLWCGRRLCRSVDRNECVVDASSPMAVGCRPPPAQLTGPTRLQPHRTAMRFSCAVRQPWKHAKEPESQDAGDRSGEKQHAEQAMIGWHRRLRHRVLVVRRSSHHMTGERESLSSPRWTGFHAEDGNLRWNALFVCRRRSQKSVAIRTAELRDVIRLRSISRADRESLQRALRAAKGWR